MGISTPLPMEYWPPYPLKRLSKPILRKISDSWYTNFEILKIFLKFYENWFFFFNLMKYVSFEILCNFWNFWNIEILIFILFLNSIHFLKFWTFLKIFIFWKFWNFITPLPIIINIYWIPSLPMVFWPPYPWYIESLNHGISTPLPMVYRPPLTMVYRPSTHGILPPITMVYRPPYPWYIDPPAHGISTPPTYGISNPLLWYYELLFW